MHITYETPPTIAGALPKPRRGGPASNIPGLLGLIFNSAAVGSFGCISCLGLPLLAVGMILCIIGCFIVPRTFAVVGLILGLLTMVAWGVILGLGVWHAANSRGPNGLTLIETEEVSDACVTLISEVEKIRNTTGKIPATLNVTAYGDAATDPWGHLYHYTLTPVTAKNGYGYTFLSDGPDGVPGNTDDLDIIAIHPADDETVTLPTAPAAQLTTPKPPGPP